MFGQIHIFIDLYRLYNTHLWDFDITVLDSFDDLFDGVWLN